MGSSGYSTTPAPLLPWQASDPEPLYVWCYVHDIMGPDALAVARLSIEQLQTGAYYWYVALREGMGLSRTAFRCDCALTFERAELAALAALAALLHPKGGAA